MSAHRPNIAAEIVRRHDPAIFGPFNEPNAPTANEPEPRRPRCTVAVTHMTRDELLRFRGNERSWQEVARTLGCTYDTLTRRLGAIGLIERHKGLPKRIHSDAEVIEAVRQCNGNISAAARLMGRAEQGTFRRQANAALKRATP